MSPDMAYSCGQRFSRLELEKRAFLPLLMAAGAGYGLWQAGKSVNKSVKALEDKRFGSAAGHGLWGGAQAVTAGLGGEIGLGVKGVGLLGGWGTKALQRFGALGGKGAPVASWIAKSQLPTYAEKNILPKFLQGQVVGNALYQGGSQAGAVANHFDAKHQYQQQQQRDWEQRAPGYYSDPGRTANTLYGQHPGVSPGVRQQTYQDLAGSGDIPL